MSPKHIYVPTLVLFALFVLAGCGGEVRQDIVPNETIWGEGGEQEFADEEITYMSREEGDNRYGLPREGKPGIADLIALFPQEGLGFGDPNIFASPEFEDAPQVCSSWSNEVIADLPMDIEVVVTLYPRQYQKVSICGQDERHYGSYTVEDDTGGMLVLRDGRVAEFTYGDRITLRVHAVTLTFGRDLDTRAILVADVLPAEQPRVEEDGGEVLVREILYEEASEPFGTENVGKVYQVDGYVHEAPTNDNFGSMILTSKKFDVGAGNRELGDLLQCVRGCEARLSRTCPTSSVWGDVCVGLCEESESGNIPPEDLPVCWQVGLGSELQRRGFQPQPGQRVVARGPVVHSFDYQMWVLSYGQVEVFDE